MSGYESHIREVIHGNIADFDEITALIIAMEAAECVDKNCAHGAAQLAGSLWQFLEFGKLNIFGMRANDSGVREVTAFTHNDCGFLAVQKRLFTRSAQHQYADGGFMVAGANDSINKILKPYNVKVVWAHRDKNGTATEWMKEMNAR